MVKMSWKQPRVNVDFKGDSYLYLYQNIEITDTLRLITFDNNPEVKYLYGSMDKILDILKKINHDITY